MATQLGPSGGGGGNSFLDNPGTIAQITVHHGNYIDALEILWTNNTTTTHGGADGDQAPHADAFILDIANGEYLTGISGPLGGEDDGGPYIGGIVLTTSTGRKSPYWGGGLFATDAGYNYAAPPGTTIVGFCGRSGKYVDAIGILYA